MQDEKRAATTSGYPMLAVLPITIATGIAGAIMLGGAAFKILGLLIAILAGICLAGFYMVAPNEAGYCNSSDNMLGPTGHWASVGQTPFTASNGSP